MSTDRSDPVWRERIRQEHEELRKLLGTIHRAVSNRATGDTGVAHLLSKLSERLRAHFVEEESGGFFTELAERTPRLTRKLDSLCVEHSQLLSEAIELAEESKHCDGTDAWWDTMAADYQHFSKQLMHHESEETKVLQQSYNEDIGEQD